MDIWNRLISSIKNKIDADFSLALRDIKEVEFKDGILYLYTPIKISKSIIENQLKDLMEETAEKLLGEKVKIHVSTTKIKQQQSEKKEDSHYQFSSLNLKYTFSNLVIGECNKLAYSACITVAENPGKIYNPLFIYGDVGLGKTHLLHATAHYLLSKNPSAKIVYTTADTFTSELISYIQKGSILEFRKKYKDLTLLLIDDVQFLAGKEKTQIEFYHIFNALHLIGSQVILSSDTPPLKITGIEKRLISRFASGLVVEVKKPDLDTKISIIKKKAESMNIHLSKDVMLFIAKTIDTSIREIEGSLLRLKAYSEILKKDINLELAREVLKDILELKQVEELSIEKIQKEVASYLGINISEMLGNSKKKKVAMARQIAMYLSRELTDSSLTQIQKAFKKKDHTTILSAIEKVKETMEKDRKFKLTVEFLKEKILSL